MSAFRSQWERAACSSPRSGLLLLGLLYPHTILPSLVVIFRRSTNQQKILSHSSTFTLMYLNSCSMTPGVGASLGELSTISQPSRGAEEAYGSGYSMAVCLFSVPCAVPSHHVGLRRMAPRMVPTCAKPQRSSTQPHGVAARLPLDALRGFLFVMGHGTSTVLPTKRTAAAGRSWSSGYSAREAAAA